MSILDIDKEYDPISPLYINAVLGFRHLMSHLMSFPTHTIWVKDFMYKEDEFSQELNCHGNTIKSTLTNLKMSQPINNGRFNQVHSKRLQIMVYMLMT